MKSEELLYSLDYVGEDLLDAAGQTVLARKRRPWLRTAVAAVLAAAVCVGGWLILKKAIPADGTPVVGTSPDTAAHTVTETPPTPTGGYEPFAVGESYLDVSAWVFDDWSRFAQINEWTLCTRALRLPVYEAEGALGPETLETRLDQAAQRLGAQRIGGNSVNVNGPFAVAGQGQTGYAAGAEILDVCAWAETDMGTLTVYGNGRVRILFDEAHRIECPVEPEIPKGLTQEQIAAVCRDVNMQACAEKVVRLLDLPPCCSAYCDNWSSLSSSFQAYTIYPIREDPVEQLRSRSFEAVSLLTVDGFRVVGLEWTQLPEPGTVCGEPSDLTRKGLYPIITVQQARQAVCEGRFLCQSRSTNWKLTEDMLSACELVYLGRSGGGVVMPFYRFWVRTDGGGSKEMESCAAVCVPAVSPELLTDFPDPPETADADRTAQEARLTALLTAQHQWHAVTGRFTRDLFLRSDGSFGFRLDEEGLTREAAGTWTLTDDGILFTVTEQNGAALAQSKTAEYEIVTLLKERLDLKLRAGAGLGTEEAGTVLTFRPLYEIETGLPDETAPADASPADEQRIRALFAEPEPQWNWYCRALLSEYADPADADLSLLFYDGLPDGGGDLSEPERLALTVRFGYLQDSEMSDVDRLPGEAVDRVLTDLFGTDRAALAAARQTDAADLLGTGYAYLPEYDCYYYRHGDSRSFVPFIESVKQTGADTFLVCYRTVSAYSNPRLQPRQWAAALEERDGAFRVRFNLETAYYLTDSAQDTGYEVVETQPAQGSAEPGGSAEGAPYDSLMLNRALTEQVLNLSVYEPGDPSGYGPSRFAIADFVGVQYDASPLTCEGSFQVYAVDPEIPADPDPDALLRLNTYQAEVGLVCYGVLSCVGEGQFRGSILADGSVELAEFSYTALPVPRTGTDTQDPDVPQERWEPFTPQSAEMRTGFETKLRVFPRYGATWASGEALPAGQRLELYAGLKIVHDDGMETDWYLAAPGDGTIGWIPASELRPSQPVTYD